MSEITQQAILTLSETIQRAAQKAVGGATFARFYDGRILQLMGDGLYKVAIGNAEPTLKVYGNALFKMGEHCYVVAPHNDNDYSRMFILGVGGAKPGEGSEDHKVLMDLVADVRQKLDKGDIVQELGQSEDKVISQRALTNILNNSTNDAVSAVLIGDTVLNKDTTKRVQIPIATDKQLGVVKGSAEENKVHMLDDGTMEVTSMDIMRLNQHDGDVLIFDGGSARA